MRISKKKSSPIRMRIQITVGAGIPNTFSVPMVALCSVHQYNSVFKWHLVFHWLFNTIRFSNGIWFSIGFSFWTKCHFVKNHLKSKRNDGHFVWISNGFWLCLSHHLLIFQNSPLFSLPFFQRLGNSLSTWKASRSNSHPTFTCCMQNDSPVLFCLSHRRKKIHVCTTDVVNCLYLYYKNMPIV